MLHERMVPYEVRPCDDQATASVEVVKPPRLNFARVCLWCGERDCVSLKCVAAHGRSEWMVCDDCGGFYGDPCYCVFGVIEARPINDAHAWDGA